MAQVIHDLLPMGIDDFNSLPCFCIGCFPASGWDGDDGCTHVIFDIWNGLVFKDDDRSCLFFQRSYLIWYLMNIKIFLWKTYFYNLNLINNGKNKCSQKNNYSPEVCWMFHRICYQLFHLELFVEQLALRFKISV